jgi:hypothetical protein
MTPTDPTLMDPDSSWWAKYSHAESHLQRLNALYDSYYETQPFKIEEEPTDQPAKRTARLRIVQPIPREIPLVVGDILHNLRSALDSLVFELVTQAVGRPLNAKEAQACQFPISPDPGSFEDFFEHGTRDKIMPPYLRHIIRLVQPFYHLEVAKRSRVEAADDLDYITHYQHSRLGELGYMSNIDKHRRLALTAWRSNMVWWGSDGESDRQWIPGDGKFEDGSIIGYIVGTDEHGSDAHYDFNLTFPDLPAYADPLVWRKDVVTLAKDWVQETDMTIKQLVHYWHVGKADVNAIERLAVGASGDPLY